MHDFWVGTLEIFFGGAALALLSFICLLMWNLRKEWILDHAWQKIAQETLEAHAKKFEEGNKLFSDIMYRLNSYDGRFTNLEHPVTPLRRNQRQVHDD